MCIRDSNNIDSGSASLFKKSVLAYKLNNIITIVRRIESILKRNSIKSSTPVDTKFITYYVSTFIFHVYKNTVYIT